MGRTAGVDERSCLWGLLDLCLLVLGFFLIGEMSIEVSVSEVLSEEMSLVLFSRDGTGTMSLMVVSFALACFLAAAAICLAVKGLSPEGFAEASGFLVRVMVLFRMANKGIDDCNIMLVYVGFRCGVTIFGCDIMVSKFCSFARPNFGGKSQVGVKFVNLYFCGR